MEFIEYYNLISSFIDNKISAEEFCKLYDMNFLKENGSWLVNNKELYGVFEDLFEDQLVYSPHWSQTKLDDLHIDEKTLRSRSIIALQNIRRILFLD
jgi:hypothetical protein